MAIRDLFETELKVVNIGLASFKESLDHCGVQAVQVDWRPPMQVDATVEAAASAIDQANEKAVKIILAGKPFLVGMGKALDVVPGMRKNVILHAGPPIAWERMCGPMRGGVIGALLYEGMAKTAREAQALPHPAQSTFRPATSTRRLVPWRELCRPPCRSSSSGTRNTATPPTPP